MKKFGVILIVMLIGWNAISQVEISRFVLGSAGSLSTSGSLMVSFTVGEPMVTTISDNNTIIFTQGFQQPSSFDNSLNLQLTTYNATCSNSKDGYAVVDVLDGTAPFTYSIAGHDGTTEGDGISDTTLLLRKGTYTLYVTDLFGLTGIAIFSVDAEYREECELHIYTGITPNGDGQNDQWIIDGIIAYPNNEVMIFNRWGDKVWEGNGYDNLNVVWAGKNSNNAELPDGSYYYIVNVPELEVYKGWVQVTR
ncbi:gliding motility-associated C-terminal domain-containing protein [Bacteroidales bacterium AH-315-I05]|nr:gliding motility-associated C-terminal domain-containing protein [Bacteroidales bacterium AH-315-I05]